MSQTSSRVRNFFAFIFTSLTCFVSAQQWTWMRGSNSHSQAAVYGTMGISTSTTFPGARDQSVTWTDKTGNLWLFGGTGIATNSNSVSYLNDLWRYVPSTNQWTWMRGANFQDQNTTFGVKGVPSSSNQPGARISAGGATDTSGYLWMFGGLGNAVSSTGVLQEMWRFDVATNQWTWMHGPNVANGFGVYGTRGVSSPSNIPGSRYVALTMADNVGNIWVFGGAGSGVSSTGGLLNDLWKYNTNTNEWTWVSGGTSNNLNGVYGTKGVASTTNVPGSRHGSHGWIDTLGNIWIFGGFGSIGSGTVQALLNDLWKYDPAADTWEWVSGSNSHYAYATPGIQGIPSVSNTPGALAGAATFRDTLGYFWLFGGQGLGPPSVGGTLNDLWRFDPYTEQWAFVKGTLTPNQSGLYGTQGVSSYTTRPGGRAPMAWSTQTNTFWIFGGHGFGVQAFSSVLLNDLWKFEPCTYPGTVLNTSGTSSAVCAGKSATISALGNSTLLWYASLSSTVSLDTGSIYVTPPMSAGVYTYYASPILLCPFTPTRNAVQVVIHPTPSVSVNNGTVCSGYVFTIVPQGAATYFYSSGSSTVIPTTSSVYSVIGQSTDGCISNVAVSTVSVKPLPNVSVNSGSVCSSANFTLQPAGAVTYTYEGGTNVISAVTNTAVTVYGTGANGCSASAVAQITVAPTPTISVSGGSICAGNQFVISPSGAPNYITSAGTFTVAPQVSTSYVVAGVSSQSCISQSVIIQVTVQQLPTVTVAGSTICPGQTATLVPAGANIYSYSGGSPVVSPAQTQTYTVTGTDVYGCSSLPVTSTVTVANMITAGISGNHPVCSGSQLSLTAMPVGNYSYVWYYGSVPAGTGSVAVFSASVSSVAKLVLGYTQYPGLTCVSQASVLISTLPLPIVSAPGGTVCEGSSFVIQPTGASNYSYSSGNNTVFPSSTTIYTVAGFDSAGCSSNAFVQVLVHDLPQIGVMAQPSITCSGETTTISITGASAYSWTSKSQDLTFNPLVTTTYTFSGVDDNGCWGYAVYTHSVQDCTGLTESGQAAGIKVFPVPASEEIFLQCPAGGTWKIIDVQGKHISAGTFQEGTTPIDLRSFSYGFYTLVVTTQNSFFAIKIVRN